MDHDDFLQRTIERQLDASAVDAELDQLDAGWDEAVCEIAEIYLATSARLEVARLTLAFAHGGEIELDEFESPQERLLGAMAAAIDHDGDGDLDDEEQLVFDNYQSAFADLLIGCGVTESDIDDFLAGVPEAGIRLQALLANLLPSDEDAADDFIVDYGYAASLPGVVVAFDAVRKNRAGPVASRPGWSWARRHVRRSTLHSEHGKRKVTTHKTKWRKPTALQMAAIRKARRRSQTSQAKVMNRRSNALTRKQGGRGVTAKRK